MEWKFQKLKEVAQVTAGQSPEGRYYNNDGKGMPFYQGKKEFTEKYIGEPVVWTSKVTKVAQEGDVLMSVRAPVGPVNFATQECCIGRGLASIRVFQNFNNDFLFHFFKHVENKLVGNTGAVFNSINKSQIEDLEIPIPSLEDQQKIVEKLDKAFELIDQAKANIEQNIINAKELFQSKLDEVFTNNENGWELKKLSELCDAKDDIVGGPFGSNLKVEHYRETGVPILRLQNIGKGYFINKDIKYVDDSKAEELSYHSFRSGDIALAKLGIPIGKTCIIPDEFSFGIVVADVVRIRPSKDIDKNFLVYFLNSNTAVRQLTGNIKGATRPRVNLSDVRNMKISIPNHLEQLKLSNYINNIESSINNLLSSYENKLSNLEELRKSILEKAFKGELTN